MAPFAAIQYFAARTAASLLIFRKMSPAHSLRNRNNSLDRNVPIRYISPIISSHARRFSMKRITIAVVAMVLVASVAFAGKTYQFTGKVLEVKDNVIVVDKSGEKFEMSKDAGTKIKGDLKVGAKVTVKYESRAAEIEVKGK